MTTEAPEPEDKVVTVRIARRQTDWRWSVTWPSATAGEPHGTAPSYMDAVKQVRRALEHDRP